MAWPFGRRRRRLESAVGHLQKVARELQEKVSALEESEARFGDAADDLARQSTWIDEQLERLEVKRRRLSALESKARQRGDLPPNGVDQPATDPAAAARLRARELGLVG